MQGRIFFKVTSSPTFLINLLGIHQIDVFNVKQKNGYCVFSVRGKDGTQTKKLLEERGKDYRITKDTYFKNRMIDLKKKLGLCFGLIILIVLGVIASQLVTDVKIEGCYLVAEMDVSEIVTESMRLPTWTKKIDKKGLERKIISMEGIANASVDVKGNVLYVRVLEELEKPEVIDYSEKKDLVSAYDGIITGIVSFSGEAKKKVGDTVKKGDVLISATETDEQGNLKDIKATGSVFGRVWVTGEYVFYDTVIKDVRTGREKTYWVGKGFSGEIDPGFASYEREEIPMGRNGIYKKIVFYETESIRENFDYFSQRESIIREKTSEIERRIDKNSIKIRTWFSEKTVDKTVYLVIYYEIVTNLIKNE